jgi:uncharacterized repeat protein (TIGR01451 family)
VQNLLWKFVVLAGVIGASCGVVYQAHQSLSQRTAAKPSEENGAFQPLLELGGLEDAPLASSFSVNAASSSETGEPTPALSPAGRDSSTQETAARTPGARGTLQPIFPAANFQDARAESSSPKTDQTVGNVYPDEAFQPIIPVAATTSEPTPPAAREFSRSEETVNPFALNSRQRTPAPQPEPQLPSRNPFDFTPQVPAGQEESALRTRESPPVLIPTPQPEAEAGAFSLSPNPPQAEVLRETAPAQPAEDEEVFPLFGGLDESPQPAANNSAAMLSSGTAPLKEEALASVSEPAAVIPAADPFAPRPPASSEPTPAISNPFERVPARPALPAGGPAFGFGGAAESSQSDSAVLPTSRLNSQQPAPVQEEVLPNLAAPPQPAAEPTPANNPFAAPPASKNPLDGFPGSAPAESLPSQAEAVPTPTFPGSMIVGQPEETPRSEPFGRTSPASNLSKNPQPAAEEPVLPSGRSFAPNAAPAQSQPAGNPFSSGVLPAQDAVGSRIPEPQPARPPGTFPLPDQPVFPVSGTGTVPAEAPRGPQQPELKIEKIAPQEAIVGEPLIYAIVVRNVGNSPAHKVVIEDRIPKGVDPRSVGTAPQAFISDDKLFWELGTMNPGDEQKIQLRVTPIEAGDIGSVATVRFAASVAASIRVTAPKLAIEMIGPSEAAVGEEVPVRFKVTNSGNGEGRKVFIRALLPPSLEHPGGNDIEYELGSIPPGESREVELVLTAAQAGLAQPQAMVTIDGAVKDGKTLDLNVITSRLKLERTGPQNRFVNRPAAYTNVVSNESTGVLENVVLKEHIPAGMEWTRQPGVDAVWDEKNRVVTWTIPQLRPGERRQFISQVVAPTAGTFTGSVTVADARGNQAELATNLNIQGFASLEVDVQRPAEPVLAVGEQVAFRVTVSNGGTAAARNVQTKILIPQGLQFVDARGPVRFRPVDGGIQFEALPELPVQGQQSFDVILTAASANRDARVRMELQTADFEAPLQREERLQIIPAE